MKRLVGLLVLGGLTVGSASAAILTQEFLGGNAAYNAWLAAVSGVQTETFTNTLTVASVVTSTGGINAGTWLDTLSFSQQPGAPPNSKATTFSYTGGTFTAVGGFFDLTPNDYGSGVIITLVYGAGLTEQTEIITFTLQNPQSPVPLFYGLTTNTPVTSIQITTQPAAAPGQDETFRLDDLSFATSGVQSEIPEPATLSLLGFGLLGMGLLRRYSRR